MRITIVTNIPTAYRAPLFDSIHELLKPDGNLTVIFGGHWEKSRQWTDSVVTEPDWEAVFAKNSQINIGKRPIYANPQIAGTVARTKPDVVIIGGYAPWTYAVMAWCLVKRVPYLIWSGETLRSAAATKPARWRRLPLARYAAGALAYGPDAADYLRNLGFIDTNTTVVGNGIDIESFRARVEQARTSPTGLANRLGFAGRRVVLAVGAKNTEPVIGIADRLDGDVQLVIAGTETGVGVEGHALYTGRLNPELMPELYASATCVVHPTELDRWPHAINEALSAGVPVVASPHTAMPEATLTGPGCSIVDPADPEALLAALNSAVQVGATADEKIREAIRDPLRDWDVPKMAELVVKAVEQACS